MLVFPVCEGIPSGSGWPRKEMCRPPPRLAGLSHEQLSWFIGKGIEGLQRADSVWRVNSPLLRH